MLLETLASAVCGTDAHLWKGKLAARSPARHWTVPCGLYNVISITVR